MISLICATANRTVELQRLLNSLENQPSGQFEIIVIDQNDKEILKPILSEFENKFQIIHKRVTYKNNSKARNEGVKLANGSILGFPDDDCWYPADLIEQIISRFDDNKQADFVYINWVDPNHSVPKYKFDFTPGEASLNEIYEIASNICFFVRKSSFLKTSGYNEALGLGSGAKIFAGEEQDLLMGAISKGLKIFKYPELIVYHPIVDREWDDTFTKRIIGSGAAEYYLHSKYIGKLSAAKLIPYWIGGVLYNTIRIRKTNLLWYFYKLKGAASIINGK